MENNNNATTLIFSIPTIEQNSVTKNILNRLGINFNTLVSILGLTEEEALDNQEELLSRIINMGEVLFNHN